LRRERVLFFHIQICTGLTPAKKGKGASLIFLVDKTKGMHAQLFTMDKGCKGTGGIMICAELD
jgi:hypothetical protein